MNAADVVACLDFVRDLRQLCEKHALGIGARDGHLVIIDIDGDDLTPIYTASIRPTLMPLAG